MAQRYAGTRWTRLGSVRILIERGWQSCPGLPTQNLFSFFLSFFFFFNQNNWESGQVQTVRQQRPRICKKKSRSCLAPRLPTSNSVDFVNQFQYRPAFSLLMCVVLERPSQRERECVCVCVCVFTFVESSYKIYKPASDLRFLEVSTRSKTASQPCLLRSYAASVPS